MKILGIDGGNIPSFCKPRLTLLLIINREPQEERAVGNAARPSAFRSAAPRPSKRFAGVGGYDQMAALIGLKVSQRPHGAHYTITSHNLTIRASKLFGFGLDDSKSSDALLLRCSDAEVSQDRAAVLTEYATLYAALPNVI